MKQLNLLDMKTKRCSGCGEVKPVSEFNKNRTRKDGLNCYCKECNKEYQREWAKNNSEKVKESSRKGSRKWTRNNPEYYKSWYKNNPEYHKEWRENNPKKVRKINRKNKKRRMSIPKNRLNKNISYLIWFSLKQNKKGNHWENLVDYTLKNLEAHLENLFEDGMNWKNMGKWHIDHIRPVSSFNFSSYEDKAFKECWALSNLQPLWAKENWEKNSTWNGRRWRYGSINS